MSTSPRMRSVKKMYDDMLNAPARPSVGHTSKAMDMADSMFESVKKAKGGVTRADGCITKGHTKGKLV